MADITVRVNGTPHSLDVDSRMSLLDLLRERLGLTGTKKGCDHGQCGACTVLIEGRRAVSCLALAVGPWTVDRVHGAHHLVDRVSIAHRSTGYFLQRVLT